MGRRDLDKLLTLIPKDPQKYFKKPKKPTYNALKNTCLDKLLSGEGESYLTFLMKSAYYFVD